ncbi:MAG: hypothetical protein LUF01_10110 [Bacteroides sp.]|nr:hypothetical protein [Bacteroides sp.]
MRNSKMYAWASALLLTLAMGTHAHAQKIPLVYSVENTGIHTPAPPASRYRRTADSKGIARPFPVVR